MSSSLIVQEGILFVSAVITLLGTKLCWSAPRARMSVEESAKDGHLTAEQARRRIKAIAWRGPIVTICGVALLMFALLR